MTAQPTAPSARYPIAVEAEPLREDGTEIAWVAYHPDLPGCMAQGATPQDAVAELTEARELYLGDLIRRGLPVPQPGSSPLAQSIAGKIATDGIAANEACDT